MEGAGSGGIRDRRSEAPEKEVGKAVLLHVVLRYPTNNMAVHLSDKSCASQPTQHILESPSTSSVISSQFPLSKPVDETEHSSGQSTNNSLGASAAPDGENSSQNATHAPINSNNSFTLEPYVPASRGRRGRGRNTRQRTWQHAPNLFNPGNMLHEQVNFKKFFVVSDPTGDSLISKIDTITANNQLEEQLRGAPEKVTELRSGSLLIKVKTLDQSSNIKRLRSLCDINVTIAEHSNLNFTKGTIRSKRYAEIDDARLMEQLRNHNVVEIYRMKKRINGDLTNTGTIILTFDQCTLPETVKIGWNIFEVREYIPLPRRCFKCQRFNHSRLSCHATQIVCCNCGTVGHEESGCTKNTKCTNCEGSHKASDRSCPQYQMEREILAVQTREKIGYGEAKRSIMKRYVRPGVSFSRITNDTDRENSLPRRQQNQRPTQDQRQQAERITTENDPPRERRPQPQDQERQGSQRQRQQSPQRQSQQSPQRQQNHQRQAQQSLPRPPQQSPQRQAQRNLQRGTQRSPQRGTQQSPQRGTQQFPLSGTQQDSQRPSQGSSHRKTQQNSQNSSHPNPKSKLCQNTQCLSSESPQLPSQEKKTEKCRHRSQSSSRQGRNRSIKKRDRGNSDEDGTENKASKIHHGSASSVANSLQSHPTIPPQQNIEVIATPSPIILTKQTTKDHHSSESSLALDQIMSYEDY